MDSILTSIKKLMGIAEEYEHFDVDLIIHINSILAILTQIGVGPSSGFTISDKTSTWSQFTSDDVKVEMVRTYIYLKAKLVFDPPLSSAMIESMKLMIEEYEWRLSIANS